jgi:hypothetical protein
MTKQAMIRQIQVAEAKAWQTLQNDKEAHGLESPIASASRDYWSALYDLMGQLDIPSLGISDLIAEDLVPLMPAPSRLGTTYAGTKAE